MNNATESNDYLIRNRKKRVHVGIEPHASPPCIGVCYHYTNKTYRLFFYIILLFIQ